ncbi:unnamed protein product [Pedinophyceae sp. YPF-701]|nr:unnamed protein product [Pedinophyceae sp. YPF-701]
MSAKDVFHDIKQTDFNGRVCPIVLQNFNGPCPLLALANILLLQGKISLPAGATEVSQATLVARVANHLFESNSKVDAEYAANQQQNINDALNLLPKLTTGVDVNVKFTTPKGFEFTDEIVVFDLLDISLVHGWLADPQDAATFEAVGGRSYNDLVVEIATAGAAAGDEVAEERSRAVSRMVSGMFERVLSGDAPDDASGGPVTTLVSDVMRRVVAALDAPPAAASAAEGPVRTTSADARATSALLAADFLRDTSSQLTHFGIERLGEELRAGELAVLFRNNHFSVVHKHAESGQLLLLVTDVGYRSEPEIVWEVLADVGGDTTFLTSTFRPYVPAGHAGHDGAPISDEALAKQLQESELRGAQADGAATVPVRTQEAPPASGGEWRSWAPWKTSAAERPATADAQPAPSPPQPTAPAAQGEAERPEPTQQQRANEAADADMALALQLQYEEEERERQRQQREREARSRQQRPASARPAGAVQPGGWRNQNTPPARAAPAKDKTSCAIM